VNEEALAHWGLLRQKKIRIVLAVKTKDELDELIRHKNIINHIKA
jgi:hypothetical protein